MSEEDPLVSTPHAFHKDLGPFGFKGQDEHQQVGAAHMPICCQKHPKRHRPEGLTKTRHGGGFVRIDGIHRRLRVPPDFWVRVLCFWISQHQPTSPPPSWS